MRAGQAPEQRAADERVREREALIVALRRLEHQVGGARLVERGGQVLALEIAHQLERLELEVHADHGGHGEQPDACVAEPCEA